MDPQANDPATTLRLFIHAQLTLGLITPALAEQMLLRIKALADAALAGQQLGALGMAATSPESVVSPTLPCTPTSTTNWGRHQQYLADGKPIAKVKESAADRRAREQAESIGYPRKAVA